MLPIAPDISLDSITKGNFEIKWKYLLEKNIAEAVSVVITDKKTIAYCNRWELHLGLL